MSQEINPEELQAKRKAQERVTERLHSEDVLPFIREGVEVQKADEHKQDANRE